MKQYRLVVLSDPAEGREDEYHNWYQNIHLPELVATSGFKVAQRFKINKAVTPGKTWSYVAIYNIETDDIDKTMAEARQNAKTPPDAVAPGAYTVIYEEYGTPVKHSDPVKR